MQLSTLGAEEAAPQPVGAPSSLTSPRLGSSEEGKTHRRMWSPDPVGLQMPLRSVGKVLTPWDPPPTLQVSGPATEPGHLNFNRAPGLGAVREPLCLSSGEQGS